MDAFGFPNAGHAVIANFALGFQNFQSLTNLAQHVGHGDRADGNVRVRTDAVVQLDQVYLLSAQPLQTGFHRLDDSGL